MSSAATNLSVSHATGTGFIGSTPVDDLHIGENAGGGTVVGYVAPTAPDLDNDIVSDGSFRVAGNPNNDTTFTDGDPIGAFTVSGEVTIPGSTYQDSPAGGDVAILVTGQNSGLTQTLQTEAGRQYQIVFQYSGDFDGATGTHTELRVTAGGEGQEFIYEQSADWAINNLLLDPRTLTFTADSSTTDLNFSLLDTGVSAVIADIQVIEIPAAVTTLLNNDPTLSYDAGTEKFYRFVDTPDNFNNALSAATGSQVGGVDGQLVTIRSQYENNLVRQFVLDSGNEIWLGVQDQNEDGNWNFLDGTVESDEQFYTGGNIGSAVDGFFVPTFGISANPGEQFARVLSNGDWADSPENSSFAYIIEWDATEVLSNFTFSLTDDAGGRFAIDADTGQVTVADGTLIDFEAAVSHNISIEVTDAAGNSHAETFSVAVDNELDANQVVPAAQTISENSTLTFSAGTATEVSVSDSLSSTDTLMRVTLSVNDGVLNLSQLTNLTIIEGADGSSSLVLEGTESDLNAALDGLEFTPDADFNGSVTLNMETAIATTVVDLDGLYTFEGGNADDQSVGTSYDGTLEGDASIVSDAQRGQVLSLDGDGDSVKITGRFGEPTNVTLSAFVNLASTDITGASVISVARSPSLYFKADGTLVGYFLSGSTDNFVESTEKFIGSGWVHVAVSIDADNSTMTLFVNGQAIDTTSTTGAISYNNTRDTFIGGAADTTRFDFGGQIDDARVYSRALSSDEIVTLAAGADSANNSVAITVDAVNNAPVVTSPVSAYSFTEQGSLAIHGTGFTVSDVDDNGSAITAVFTVGEGRVLIDPATSGVTVLTGNSTDTVTFSGTAAEINALLDGTSGTITFLHDQTVASDTPSASTTITLTVNDQGNTGSDPGDSGDGSSEEGFASQTINITSVNDAPTFLGPELVSNGDFSNSNLAGTGWTTTGAAAVQSGQLNFGASNATTENTLSQTINTVDGETYTLSFNYRDRSGGTNTRNQSLVVSVDGDENLLTTEAILTDTDDEIYVRYSFTFTADSATSTIKFTDTSANAGSMSSGTDSSDGRLDNISVKQTDGNLSAVTFVEDSTAVVLDSDLTLSDAEISEGLDNYDGTTLVLNRNGGANSEDVFSATGDLVFDGSQVKFPISGTEQVIGTLTNSDGTLSIQFTNASLTEANINEILQSITYSNTNQAPPSSVQIDWTFNDSNEAAESDPQGTGGSLTATGSTTVNITAVNDAPVLTQNDFSISEGGVLTLTTSNINATDAEGDSLTFTVTNVTGGGFYVGADGSYNSDQSFTMAQLLAGDVVFLHGGTDDAPAFEVSVSDGTDSTSAVAANITFTEVNDRPYIDAGGLSDVSIINTTVSGDQVQPESITLSDGSLVVAYSDGTNTYAQRFDSSGNAFGIEIQLDDTASSSEVDIVATSDGGFIATWTDSINLYARRFDSSGVAVNGSTEIDFAIDTDRTRPEITELSDGKILLSYFAGFGVDSSDQTVAATLLDANFNDSAITAEISNEIIVPDVQAGTQFDPKITALAGGGFAIAFSDGVGRDGDGHGVFVQFYDTSGNLVGANQQVNANTDGNQQVFDVEQLTNGDVLVAYRDINAGGGFNTFAQRYSDTGVAQGSPFVLNQTTSGFQNAIDLVPLSDGKFAASWITFLDNGERQVFVRQFDASGSPLTDELFVAAGDIIASPTIAAMGDDSVRISWTGDAGSGNGEDIFSRSISFAPHSVSFTENATGVVLHDSINLIDFDDSDLTGATLQITGNFATAEDALNFSNQNNITGIYDSVNGTLTLTGTDSIANYEAALRSITYVNGSDNPDTSTRSVQWTVTDGTDDSYTTTTEVDVIAVNDAPTVSSPASPFSFTEQGSLAIQGTGFLVSDVDDNGGQLTAFFTVGEGRVLIDPATSGVTVSTGNSTDTVTFSGTEAEINSLLDGTFGTITYLHDQTAASDTPSASTTITLTVNDRGNTGADPGDSGDASSEEGSASQTINITSVNDAPTFLGAELISNGTFDSGISPWMTTGTAEFEAAGDGGRLAFGAGNEPGPNSIFQTVATAAGESYEISFDYRDTSGSRNQSLQLTVDGAAIC